MRIVMALQADLGIHGAPQRRTSATAAVRVLAGVVDERDMGVEAAGDPLGGACHFRHR